MTYTKEQMKQCWDASRRNALHPGYFGGVPGFDAFLTTLRETQPGDGVREALREIASQDDFEMALDPQWAKRIALAALGEGDTETVLRGTVSDRSDLGPFAIKWSGDIRRVKFGDEVTITRPQGQEAQP